MTLYTGDGALGKDVPLRQRHQSAVELGPPYELQRKDVAMQEEPAPAKEPPIA
jgi:hypothetical protein